MSVLEFGSEAEAYAIANDNDYGLAAGVWTKDLALAHRASRALRVGSVWVNTYQMVYPTVPYGGFKLSGHGKMLGAAYVEEMTQVKAVWMKVGA
jgi:acyl-CoA reductase-like NAD-dependent aldehyde dehydrogenase